MTSVDVTCPACGAFHDPRPCAAEGAMCACCEAMFEDQETRAAACERLDEITGVACEHRNVRGFDEYDDECLDCGRVGPNGYGSYDPYDD